MNKKDPKKDRAENQNSRRDAIRRLGIIGLGAAIVSRAGKTVAAGTGPQPVRLQSCYGSCLDEYSSIDSYYSYAEWGMGTYNSTNRYTSGGCYYSCSQ